MPPATTTIASPAADIAQPAMRRRVNPDDATLIQPVRGAVAKTELDLALMDEVGLLLLIVVVDAPVAYSGGRTSALIPNAVTPTA